MDNTTILRLYLKTHQNLIIEEVNKEKKNNGIGLLVVDVTNIKRIVGFSCSSKSTYYLVNDIPGAFFTYKEQIMNDPESSTSVYYILNIEGSQTFYKKPEITS